MSDPPGAPVACRENVIAKAVVDSAFKIHSSLGPGLLESVYEVLLAHELRARGFDLERQRPIPLVYNGLHFEEGFRADLWIENKVIVEIKSIDELGPVHGKQVLTYLRLTGLKLGLLINFGSPVHSRRNRTNHQWKTRINPTDRKENESHTKAQRHEEEDQGQTLSFFSLCLCAFV